MLKLRYVFEDISTYEVEFRYATIEQIELGISKIFQAELRGYRLIARDRCTGMLDKNGKDIYENDIDKYNFVITYSGDKLEDSGMNVGWYYQRDDFESWSELEYDIDEKDRVEITGTVYDYDYIHRYDKSSLEVLTDSLYGLNGFLQTLSSYNQEK